MPNTVVNNTVTQYASDPIGEQISKILVDEDHGLCENVLSEQEPCSLRRELLELVTRTRAMQQVEMIPLVGTARQLVRYWRAGEYDHPSLEKLEGYLDKLFPDMPRNGWDIVQEGHLWGIYAWMDGAKFPLAIYDTRDQAEISAAALGLPLRTFVGRHWHAKP